MNKDKTSITPLKRSYTNFIFQQIQLLKKSIFGFSVVPIFVISLLFSSCNVAKVFKDNNIENVKTIVNSGGDINQTVSGYTRLYLAVMQKDLQLIQFLLDNGADVNKKSNGGWQPLHKAILDNRPEIVKILVDKGADVKSANPLGETPIQMAKSKGYDEIVKLLDGQPMINSQPLASDTLGNKRNNFTKTNTDSIGGKQTNKKDKSIVYAMFIKPIPTWIGPTRFSGVDVFSPENYNISMWGIGGGFQKNIYKDFSLLVDFARHSFKQDLVKEGESKYVASTVDGDLYLVPFPLGVKYTTLTTSMRIGLKYTYKKSKIVQPWVGLAYGLNIWDVKYVSFDEQKEYGKANGIKFRHALMAGVDVRMEEVGMITFFFDAVSPVAEFTMKDLFGLGDFYQFDATTYPSPRIGISVGIFN